MEVDINQSYVDAFAVRIQNWDMLALQLQPNEFVRYVVLRNSLVRKIQSEHVGETVQNTVQKSTTSLIEGSYETLNSFWKNQNLELIIQK